MEFLPTEEKKKKHILSCQISILGAPWARTVLTLSVAAHPSKRYNNAETKQDRHLNWIPENISIFIR